MLDLDALQLAEAQQSDYTNTYLTSSSAVAKRPRNASCLSVVSFNSTKPLSKRRALSFIVSYVGYRFITACN